MAGVTSAISLVEGMASALIDKLGIDLSKPLSDIPLAKKKKVSSYSTDLRSPTSFPCCSSIHCFPLPKVGLPIFTGISIP